MKDCWVTGLTGNVSQRVIDAGLNSVTKTLNAGDPWTIRWDYDEAKGSHVNFEFGSKPQSKIVFEAPKPCIQLPSAYYLDAIKDQTNFLGYRSYINVGTPGERIYIGDVEGEASESGGSQGAAAKLLKE